jgi:hypothetical protein
LASREARQNAKHVKCVFISVRDIKVKSGIAALVGKSAPAIIEICIRDVAVALSKK